MKFTWFNLMPWPDLPGDFRETNPSVWVDIPSRLYDPAVGNPNRRVSKRLYRRHTVPYEQTEAVRRAVADFSEH
jgi:hypothetical protein